MQAFATGVPDGQANPAERGSHVSFFFINPVRQRWHWRQHKFTTRCRNVGEECTDECDVSLAEQLPGLWNVAADSTGAIPRGDAGYFEKFGGTGEGGRDSSILPGAPMPIGGENVTQDRDWKIDEQRVQLIECDVLAEPTRLDVRLAELDTLLGIGFLVEVLLVIPLRQRTPRISNQAVCATSLVVVVPGLLFRDTTLPLGTQRCSTSRPLVPRTDDVTRSNLPLFVSLDRSGTPRIRGWLLT
ncbi:hypothetical protein K7711_09740 [Nocardia sp. CA2R105]|uniref:hypothetical protein n=1 Tax=Nocardia coffeae TaxID=2873381 RepID=UPI001CA64F8A|nr:hypothetical protein [Nocardia coffeae]MBY8856757.1 hypothetical protein [Nocardia coffeae]